MVGFFAEAIGDRNEYLHGDCRFMFKESNSCASLLSFLAVLEGSPVFATNKGDIP